MLSIIFRQKQAELCKTYYDNRTNAGSAEAAIKYIIQTINTKPALHPLKIKLMYFKTIHSRAKQMVIC